MDEPMRTSARATRAGTINHQRQSASHALAGSDSFHREHEARSVNVAGSSGSARIPNSYSLWKISLDLDS
jgi:hypothetical protein